MSNLSSGLKRPAWVEIDLSALRHNVRQIQKHVNGLPLYGVVKADAYGHGAVRVAKTLEEEGLTDFAVATLEEAIELREAGISGEILILGLVPAAYAEDILAHRLTIVLDSVSEATAYSEAAATAGKTIPFFLALDTGMGRIGVPAGEDSAVEDARAMAALPGLTLRGVISHFATADETDKTYADEQFERYKTFLDMTAGDPAFPVRTLANSAAIAEIDRAWFDAARPGIILYGHGPSGQVTASELDLRPVMQVKATILKIKDLPAGATVSYGRRFKAERPSRIATLPIGYADGYPRPFSGSGTVLIGGQEAPLAGNICMDQCMVDVTDLPDVRVGDEVTILSAGPAGPTAEAIALACGTIPYEVLCGFGLRLPKVYLDEK